MSTELTIDEAIAAIERCAFMLTEFDDATDEPMWETSRRMVHCFIGTMGADWDVEAAINEVRAARFVGWGRTLFGECLVVTMPNDRTRAFDTVTPQALGTDAKS